MENWKIIFLSIALILFINKITLKFSIDIIGLKNENESDFRDFRIIIYWWSFNKKQRMSKIIY